MPAVYFLLQTIDIVIIFYTGNDNISDDNKIIILPPVSASAWLTCSCPAMQKEYNQITEHAMGKSLNREDI